MNSGCLFTPASVFSISLSVIMGLIHASSLTIIHRDLKMNNILVSRDGTVKIPDFGEGRKSEIGEEHTADKGQEEVRAPECWLPSATDQSKCDVWSFGIFLSKIAANTTKDKVSHQPIPPCDVGLTAAECRLIESPSFIKTVRDKILLVRKNALVPPPGMPYLLNILRDCLYITHEQRPGYTEILSRLCELTSKEEVNAGKQQLADFLTQLKLV